MNSDERIGRAACRVALAVAVTASILGLPGCGKSNSSSSGSAGQTTTITAPTGTVSGTVEDNNGNPIAGASVYVAGQTPVTTNAGGQFSVGVVVSGAAAGNGATANGSGTTPNQALTIQIVPPTGYLAASITVTPAAQVTSSDNGSSATGETNPQEVFIDGFSASAGIVLLPKESTTVTGTILNKQTGLPLPAGTHVDLDFIGANFNQAATTTGVAVTYGSGSILTATTSATGVFTLTNVADDSCYEIDVPTYELSMPANTDAVQTCNTANTNAIGTSDPLGFSFSTQVESPNSVTFSQILALPATTGDLVNPYVTSVASIVSEAATTGQFDSNVTNTITVKFDEPMTYTASTAFPVTVFVGMMPNVTADAATASLGADQETLTITLATPLPQKGQPVLVNLPVQAFTDLAGNALEPGSLVKPEPPLAGTVTTTTGNVPTRVGFDGTADVTLTGSNTQVVQLSLQEFLPLTTTAAAPTLAEVFSQVASKATDPAYQTTSALVNVADATTALTAYDTNGYQVTTTGDVSLAGNVLQLNSQLGNTIIPATMTPSDAAYYLTNLVQALRTPQGGPANTDKAFTDVARVAVTIPVGATDVALSVQRNNLTENVLFFGLADGAGLPPVPEGPVSTGTTPSSGTTLGNEWYLFKAPAGATLPYTFDVVIFGDAKANLSFGPPLMFATGDSLAMGTVTSGSIAPGDTVYAVTRANLLVGNSANLVLQDEVPPTTTVQLLQKAIAAGAGATSGAGGGVIASTGANTGTVILPVSPQAGNVVYSSSTLLSADSFAGNDTLDVGVGDPAAIAAGYTSAAVDLGMMSIINSATTDSVPCLNSINLPNAAFGQCVLADATSTATYLTGEALNVPLGIDIDEPVALTGTTAPTYTGTNATLTKFVAGLNQVSTKGNTSLKANLIGFTASNLVALQADGRAKAVIGLTGAIEDLASTPNVATAAANANVQLRDVFPPLMTRGFFDGTNLVIDFDEPITLNGKITFADSAAVGATACPATPISLSFTTTAAGVPPITLVTGPNGANTEVVIPALNIFQQQTTPGKAFNIANCLGGTTGSPFATGYAEAAYTAASLGTTTNLAAAQIVAKPTHGVIDYSSVPDTANNTDIGLSKGNTWANWSADNLGLNNAQFLAADILGPFALVNNPINCSGDFANATSFTCTILLTQPLLIGVTTATNDASTNTPTPLEVFPTGTSALTPTQISTYICGTYDGTMNQGTTLAAGKIALVSPAVGGGYNLVAPCTSAILENSAGTPVYNNTATQIIVTFANLGTTGGAVPASGDLVELAALGTTKLGQAIQTTGVYLQSAFVPSGASITEGTTPVSNGIIADADNKASPVPAFEMIGFPTP